MAGEFDVGTFAKTGFVEKVPATPPIRAAFGIRALNTIARCLANGGVAAHRAYVDASFSGAVPANLGLPGCLGEHPDVGPVQVFDPDPATVLGFDFVTTTNQAMIAANILRNLIPAHIADGTYAHLSKDVTSASITAPAVTTALVGNPTAIGTGSSGVLYTPVGNLITVEHKAPGTATVSTTTATLVGNALTVNLAESGDVTAFGTSNSGFSLVAAKSGVSVVLHDPGTATANTTSSATGLVITVVLANTLGSAVTATAAETVAAILADAGSAALIATTAKLGNGTGVVVPVTHALAWTIKATAAQVVTAVSGSAAYPTKISAVAVISGGGSGNVLVSAIIHLALTVIAQISLLLNQIKTTVGTHYNRAPEHNALPAVALTITSPNGTDDASNITLVNELISSWCTHTSQAAYTFADDPRSP